MAAGGLATRAEASGAVKGVGVVPGPVWEDDVVAEGTATRVTASRKVELIFENVEQAEGRGARVRRSIGHPRLRNLGTGRGRE
jgi:hypothetical protein